MYSSVYARSILGVFVRSPLSVLVQVRRRGSSRMPFKDLTAIPVARKDPTAVPEGRTLLSGVSEASEVSEVRRRGSPRKTPWHSIFSSPEGVCRATGLLRNQIFKLSSGSGINFA